jgi:CubicO group peptidase (beta-lactamase class C family)
MRWDIDIMIPPPNGIPIGLRRNSLSRRIAIGTAVPLFFAALALSGGVSSGEAVTRLDQDAKAFASLADSLRGKGFRPTTLDLRGTPQRPLFTSSWIRGTADSDIPSRGLAISAANDPKAPAWAIAGPAEEQPFRDSLAAWRKRGYRPRAVTALEPLFAAILEKDSTPVRTVLGLDIAAFQAAVDTAQRGRWRCVWVDVYGTAAKPLFAALWKRNASGVAWNYSMGDQEDQLHVKMDIFSRVWVRPAFLAPMPGGRYLTLWEENSIGPWAAHADLSEADLAADLEREAAQGLFPLCLQAFPASDTAAAVRYSVMLAGRTEALPRAFTVTGPESPGMESFDGYMRKLMSASGARAGALAIAHDGRLAFAHGYTWAEEGYPLTRPNSLFRAASCSKPLTSIMVHQSLRKGGGGAKDGEGAEGGGDGASGGDGAVAEPKEKPSLKGKILSLLNPLSESGETEEPADARFKDITVDQLLTHSGGWARSRRNPDPVFNDYAPGSEIRKRLPASRKDFLKYMLGQPLQFDPGSRSVYDNFGYFLLGRMLESLPMGVGKTYESLAGEKLFRPLGLSRPRFGNSRFEERAPGEVLYHTAVPYLQANPDRAGQPWVPGGYGDFDLKNMDAAGAWILSAPDYAKVLAAFDLGAGNPILDPEGVSTMWGDEGARSGYLRGWFAQKIVFSGGDTAVAKWHNGLFPGTSTLVFHLPGRFSFALFLNRDLSPQPEGGREGVELSRLAGAIKTWPAADLFPEMGIPSFAPESRTAARAAEHTAAPR